MKPIVIVCIVLVTLVSCARRASSRVLFLDANSKASAKPVGFEEQLIAIRSSDGIVDAKSAFGTGDYRFVAVAGLAMHAPGLAPRTDCFQKMRIKIIAGTSDMIRNEIQGQLNEAAAKYAWDYNSEMLVLLSSQGESR